MKLIYTGLESSGKSLLLANKTLSLLARNIRWRKKYGFIRPIYTNLRLSSHYMQKYADYLVYWSDMREIVGLKGCDIIWDEISSDFNSLKREPLSRQINKWLRQGAKTGVAIYSTAQEYHDLHLDYRRRVSYCYHVRKIIGSSRSGVNSPPVNFIWGLCSVRSVNIHPYNELQPEYLDTLPTFFLITRKLCEVFDTNQEIIGSQDTIYLRHVEKRCELSDCSYNNLPLEKRIAHK